MSDITYEILQGNRARVFGLGHDIIYPTDLQGQPFLSYADAEAYAVEQIARINKEKLGIQYAYVHVTLSGGDGRNDPIGVANDGIEGLNVVCTARQSADPGSPVVESLPDRTWRLLLRTEAGSAEYETISASMVSGVMSFTYKTTNQLAVLVKIDPKDMNEIFELGGFKYGIRLVGDLQFKVYRKL
ncbi:hypothetical protein [Desulforegula conservatrix]|uniref:hypothetical protein n=1 Tax=Desulforegula conservatrix TaxID=153026 RepID=UPI00040ED24D|nr:hypothetical protein [Desulforegula conservatrix]